MKKQQAEIAILHAINSVLMLEVPIGRGKDMVHIVIQPRLWPRYAKRTTPAAGHVSVLPAVPSDMLLMAVALKS